MSKSKCQMADALRASIRPDQDSYQGFLIHAVA